ncbi:protein kinase [bacterium]|nr:protein kinase [bacterium]
MKIGLYEITQELGRGSMGVVYKGYHSLLKRQVAIKTILPDKDKGISKSSIDRFLLEAQALAQLDHANIIKIHDIGLHDDSLLFIVMEYVDGFSLDELIDNRVPDTETIEKREHLFEQILEAVQYAHKHGVVHRDLKPGNIMVNNGQVKIIDFGLAFLNDEHNLTKKGDSFSTSCYCSPEHITNFKETDERTDIYSLGAILFKMLTGRLPFEVENGDLDDMLDRLVKSPPPSPIIYNSRIPEPLAKLTLRCLQKSKEDRFQNLSELRASFEDCIYGTCRGLASLTTTGGQVFIVAQGKSDIFIGRSSSADINLKEVDPERRISRRHGQIIHKDGHYFYKDLGSSNGSYLNGVKLASDELPELHKGDHLRLGRTEFIFKV